MHWKFIIEDVNLVQTIIDDPVGWADCVFKFKRDTDLHGIFFEYNTSLKFYGEGYSLINTEYQTNGVEGYMRLIIEFACSDTDPFETFYESRINFTKIEFDCSDVCLVSVPIEDDSCLTLLKNRQDQKVDLGTLVALDGGTLPDYSLPLNVTLAPKTFILESEADQTSDQETDLVEVKTVAATDNPTSMNFWQIGLNNILTSDAGQVDPTIISYPTAAEVQPLFIADRTGIYNLDLAISFQVFMGAHSPGVMFISSGGLGTFPGFNQYFVELVIEIAGVPTVLNDFLSAVDYYPPNTTCDPPDSADYSVFDVTYTNAALSLNAGDTIKLYVHVNFGMFGGDTITWVSGSHDYEMCSRVLLYENTGLFFHNNYFNISVETNNGATPCDVVLVNEALSRTCESVTNDCIRVKSDYFGRTDSLPYPSDVDGPGSLEALTNGLKIRQWLKNDTLLLFSFNDVYNGLNAIHHIGMGLEPDTERADGHEWLRVEPARYFYDTAIILVCDKVPDIQIRVISQEHYSIFNFGYAKWEAEEYNGLDEFCTKRSYRTSLQSVKNTLSQVCNFIASGYAVEITKGQGRTTKDWRYDNDQFIICMERTGPYDDTLIVEQGNFTDSNDTIIDPATVYNFRISPVRNLLRWAWKLLASYINPVTGKLIYMSGEGNFDACGLLQTDPVEETILHENETEVTSNKVNNPLDALPVYRLEEWSFRYPMSVADYHAVKANPRGIIQVRYGQNEEFHDCYIRSIEYKPVKGEAQFTLLPRFVGYDSFGLAQHYCEGDGAVILTPVLNFEGGTFSGDGVITFGPDQYFDPADPSVTLDTEIVITYTVGGFVFRFIVIVSSLPTMPAFPTSIDISDPPFPLTGATPAGGIYTIDFDSIPRTEFDPAAVGAGDHIITYIEPVGSCSRFVTITVTV